MDEKAVGELGGGSVLEPIIPGLIQQAGEIPGVNQPFDAITLHADAVQGAMLGPYLCKISFIEHFMEVKEKELKARYVLNLTMPTPQLRAMGELFTRLADELDQTLKTLNANGQ